MFEAKAFGRRAAGAAALAAALAGGLMPAASADGARVKNTVHTTHAARQRKTHTPRGFGPIASHPQLPPPSGTPSPPPTGHAGGSTWLFGNGAKTKPTTTPSTTPAPSPTPPA